MSVVQIINRSGGTSDTGGGGSTTLKIENLSSQVNGSNINFSTSSQFVENSIQVYYNGMLQIQGGSDDYTEDGDRRGVTFALAPETGTKVVVIYSESA
tara:strand:+ start:616 stop:909 length:294 start_codon:yes stop_codon:yes gene_type:complete